MDEKIAFLRGINVGGGRTRLPMETLRATAHALGWTGVRTYIQSGNLLFAADSSEEEAARALGEALEPVLGWRVPVVVRTVARAREILAWRPFGEGPDGTEHIVFLSGIPDPAAAAVVAATPGKGDEVRLRDREVHLLTRGPYHETVFSNAFLEKKLGVAATTRKRETVVAVVGWG